MKKKKSLLRRILPWLVCLALLACLVIFVGIPLYGPQEAEELPDPEVFYRDEKLKKVSMENDSLLFEMDGATTQFTLTEKETGRVWRSNPENAASDPIAVSTNKAILQSTMIVTYSSSSGVIDYNNYQYSVENGTFRIEEDEDGKQVKVEYAVGRIEKVYQIPQAITVDRFNAFMDALSSKDAKKVKNVYSLSKPDKVATLDNKDEMLALYPSLEDTELYVLKSDTSASNKGKMEGYFADAGYTAEDYALDMENVAGATENQGPVFNISVIYKLDGEDLLVEVPYQEIRYRADYPMTYVTVLPMFGAAGTAEEGYMLVPEGGGALIRYNNGKLSQNAYYANMYGWDYGTERREVVSETKNTFPVFGMTGNGGAFLCLIEGAQSYSGIQADIAGRTNSYNTVSAKYNVLHSDRYNVSAKTAKLVYMFEKALPADTIVQRYRFYDTEDISSLAVAYGDYLRADYPELAEREVSEYTPVSVEMVGAIDKRVVRFGLPVNSVVPMTTFQEASEMIGDLKSSGVQDFSVRFSGWANGGVSQKVLNRVKIERTLGGSAGMEKLIGNAKALDVPLYYDGVSAFAYRSGVLQGFIPYAHAARFTTREQVKLYPYSVVYFQSDDFYDPYYLVKPGYAKERAENLIGALNDISAYGVAFRDVGYLLSADYNPKETVTREQVKDMQIDLARKAQAAGEKVMIKEGYDYVMPYADFITDMDLNGIAYSILDESIPFYQMAIHGNVDYTGLPINLSQDWETEFLRCVEYGAGLNFTFMAEDGKMVQDTLYSGLYGADYSAWGEKAKALILGYQEATKGLNCQRMVGHEEIDRDVVVSRYADGSEVYVNYTREDYAAGDTVIPARSYVVKGGEGA
ncbi:MAG: hypothetical protein IJ229_07410 [Clostridia bacterium]|nr:hypothetical protein [Clostridia bacterium]